MIDNLRFCSTIKRQENTAAAPSFVWFEVLSCGTNLLSLSQPFARIRNEFIETLNLLHQPLPLGVVVHHVNQFRRYGFATLGRSMAFMALNHPAVAFLSRRAGRRDDPAIDGGCSDANHLRAIFSQTIHDMIDEGILLQTLSSPSCTDRQNKSQLALSGDPSSAPVFFSQNTWCGSSLFLLPGDDNRSQLATNCTRCIRVARCSA